MVATITPNAVFPVPSYEHPLPRTKSLLTGQSARLTLNAKPPSYPVLRLLK
jgi:hypothetical protein